MNTYRDITVNEIKERHKTNRSIGAQSRVRFGSRQFRETRGIVALFRGFRGIGSGRRRLEDGMPIDLFIFYGAPLELLMDGDVLVAPDQLITLEWVPAGPTGKSRIEFRLDISRHGGQKGEIVCDIEDISSFNIPASLATQLLNLGIADYPAIEIMRVAIGTVMTRPGRVLLKMQTIERRQVRIPGPVSCSNDRDCPSGQACLDSFMCG